MNRKVPGKKKGCSFCEDRKKFEDRRFYKGSHWWAALDANPMTPGNSIVVSIEHWKSILEAPREVMEELGTALKQVSQAIKEHFETETALAKYKQVGLIDRAENGRIRNVFLVALGEGEGTQHLHFHVIPYYESHHRARGKVKGKMMSWLGQRELLRDGGRERAPLAGVKGGGFYDKTSRVLRLCHTAGQLKKIIKRYSDDRSGTHSD